MWLAHRELGYNAKSVELNFSAAGNVKTKEWNEHSYHTMAFYDSR